ncbi:hypothetical protein diail_6167, partial [Diaporthe ilicicola]
MSDTGRDDGDANAPLSPEATGDDPIAVLLGQETAILDPIDEDTPGGPENLAEAAPQSTPDSDGGPSFQPAAVSDQNLDGGGTQDTSAMEQPQQGDEQGATPVRPEAAEPSNAQSPASDTVAEQTPSPSGAGPQTPSGGEGIMSRLLNRWIVGAPSPRARRSNTTGGGDTGSVDPGSTPTSTPTAPRGSRSGSLTGGAATPFTGSPSSELVGPSRRRLNSQASSSRGSAGSPSRRGNVGSRRTRANTELSIDPEAGDFQAIGANTPTPIGVRPRPLPFGVRGADDDSGSLPTTPMDPEWELRRRNRALLEIYDIIRTQGLTTDWPGWEQGRDNVREWTFQIGVNTLDDITDEAVQSMTGVLAGANVSDEIRNQILREVDRRGQATRDKVNNALVDERDFLDTTANNIVRLMESANIPGRRRGASSAPSVASQSSQPEPAPMQRRALMRHTREELVDLILDVDQQRREAEHRAGELEDEAQATRDRHSVEIGRYEAEANTLQRNHLRETRDLRDEVTYWQDLAGPARPADPPPQEMVTQPPSRSESRGSRETTRSRSQTGSAPRSPAREQAFEDLRTVFSNIAQHERLVRRLQERAGLKPGDWDAGTAPWSPNAQIPRTQLLLQLQTITGERDEARQNEDRLQARVDALEAARLSPPSPRGGGLFGNLFGANRERHPSSGDSRSRSGSRVNQDAPPRNFADELEAQGSGESDPASGQSDAASRQSNTSRRQSNTSRRQSNASRRQSNTSSRQSNASRGQSDADHPGPLRVIPEWLATHPNGPCDDCLPVFRFPPELGELPTCGCTCELALGIPPRSAASSSSRSSSSRSRASSTRSVRFANDGTPGDENNGRRRPAPLNLTAITIPEEDDTNRPDTPHPMGTDSGHSDAPASEAQPVAVVSGATGDRRGQRCPCCGRGAYGPPAAGGPQVAFFTCRTMAGQRAPMSLAEGLRSALSSATATAASVIAPGGRNSGNGDHPAPPEPVGPVGRDGDNSDPPAGPRPVAPEGRGRRNTDPPVGPGPIAPDVLEGRNRRHTDPGRVPIPERAPRHLIMTILTLFWDLVSFLPILQIRELALIVWYFLSLIYYQVQLGLYWNLRYLARLDVMRPVAARMPVWEIKMFALWSLVVWLITMLIALYEERRIWRAANAHISAA